MVEMKKILKIHIFGRADILKTTFLSAKRYV